jgi:predicted porin
MQKKLLALAIAGAMAAPLAAQAQGSNVTIYGIMQPSVDFVDNGDESGTSMSDNNSRLGFKGSEDLGNGLKAIFQIESAIDLDDREGELLARRDTWAGLSGSFGSTTFGLMFAAYKRSTDFVDPFADTLGDYNNIVSAFRDGGDTFNSRFTNAVHYTSPKWGGFQLMATYGLGGDADDDGFEDDSDDDDDDSFSLAGTYAWGPMNFALAFEDQGSNTENQAGTGDDADVRAWKLGASYKFGNTTIAALWANEEFGYVDSDGDDDGLRDLEPGERDVWFLSVKHVMGKVTLAASYTQADDFDDIDDSGVKAFAVGAVYGFSKRTNVGAYYVDLSNDDNAHYGLDSGYSPSGFGEDLNGFSVRLRHTF